MRQICSNSVLIRSDQINLPARAARRRVGGVQRRKASNLRNRSTRTRDLRATGILVDKDGPGDSEKAVRVPIHVMRCQHADARERESAAALCRPRLISSALCPLSRRRNRPRRARCRDVIAMSGVSPTPTPTATTRRRPSRPSSASASGSVASDDRFAPLFAIGPASDRASASSTSRFATIRGRRERRRRRDSAEILRHEGGAAVVTIHRRLGPIESCLKRLSPRWRRGLSDPARGCSSIIICKYTAGRGLQDSYSRARSILARSGSRAEEIRASRRRAARNKSGGKSPASYESPRSAYRALVTTSRGRRWLWPRRAPYHLCELRSCEIENCRGCDGLALVR